MCFAYAFGGLIVSSSFELQGLRPFRDKVDGDAVVVRFFIGKGSQPDDGRQIYRWPGRYGMSLWSQGRDWLLMSARNGSFLITEDGCSVACFPDSRNASFEGIGEILVRRVLPRLAPLHGRVSLHAASLSDGEGSCLLMGSSGAGKSTLSAALNRELGWDVLSDDISILHNNAWPPVVSPAAMGVCLRRDSLSGLDIAPACLQKLTAYENKFWCGIEDERILFPKPIRAFLALTSTSGTGETSDKVEVERISVRNALAHLIHMLIRFNPMDMILEARLFKSLSNFAISIPMYTLSFPRSYSQLRSVAEAIRGVCCSTSGSFP